MATTEPATEPTRPRTERSPKRVRVLLEGDVIADTTDALLVWEIPYYPTYYIPESDITAQLVPTGKTERSSHLGTGELLDVVTARATAPAAARRYPDSPAPQLRDAVRLEWSAMSEWLEEDEPVYIHPRDPYSRVDILASSRHVRVELDGVTVADSRAPHILFETGLPPRYYLPLADVRTDLLRPSSHRTGCPYKGNASYWSVEVNGRTYDNLAWTYRTPLPESQKIAGLVCFYDEQVDMILDGQPQPRPRTHFSPPQS